MHGGPIQYEDSHAERLANFLDKQQGSTQTATGQRDEDQDANPFDSKNTNFENEVWHDAAQCERDHLEHKLKELSRLFMSRVHWGFVASTGLLDKIGKQRDDGRPCSTAGYVMQDVQSGAVPIVIDTGCSISVTPFFEDFASESQPAEEEVMQGLKDAVQVKGIGWVDWTTRDVFNRVALVRTQAYHIPEARIHLLSTQTYFQEHDAGSVLQDKEKVILNTANGENLSFPYDLGSNLPSMCLDHRTPRVGLSGRQVMNLMSNKEIEHTLTLLDELNHNMSKPQKELMIWHQRLGHAGFDWIQSLMRKPKDEIGDNDEPPVMPTKISSSANCDKPKCAACALSKAHQRTPKSHTTQTKPENEMAMRRDNLNPGDCVSMDQYQTRIPGRLPHTFGKESPTSRYTVGTIFVDHASGYVHLHHQVSLRSGPTLQGKHDFERFADQFGIKLKSFYADDNPFASKEILDDLELQNQTITFSGVGAHHQNGVSERSIKTVTSWALSYMMHQLLHWPAGFEDDLWPFALGHAITMWNHLPQSRSGLSPLELFTRTKFPRHDIIRNARVWGCPVYVLDPALQDGHKLPKWTKKSRLTLHLGALPTHSPTVSRLLDLKTGHVSPQCHVVYDELFQTVQGQVTEEVFDQATWTDLVRLGHSRCVDPEDDYGDAVPFHDFYKDFVGPLASLDESDTEVLSDSSGNSDPPPAPGSLVTDLECIPPPLPLVSEGDSPPEGDCETSSSKRTPAGPNDPPLIHMDPICEDDDNLKTKPIVRPKHRKKRTPSHDRLQSGTYRTRTGRLVQPTVYTVGTHFQHPTRVHDRSIQSYQHLASGCANQKMRARALLASQEQGLNWTPYLSSFCSVDSKRSMLSMLKTFNLEHNVVEEWTPLALAANGNDADTPNWEQAMNGPNATGFWEACKIEIDTLVKKGCWEVVKKQSWMNISPGTWAFKIKRFPDGPIKKLKARFCARGDKQLHGVDFFNTHAPVVNWTTVRLILTLTAQLGLATKQVDHTAAFIHADIDLPPNFDSVSPEEQARQGVYVEMPRGFAVPGHVLKLKKSLCGLKQSPRNFFNFLKGKLEKAGFEQAHEVDPCLFLSDKVICLTYVDDCVMVAKDVRDIDAIIQRLKDLEIELTEEDDVAGFLGVHIERTSEHIKLTQKGLTKRIIEALQVQDLPTVDTPADTVLGKDLDGDPPNCTFNCASVIGMLWHLCGHGRPDLGFACSQAARFAFAPKRSHELALIRIGQCLKGTMNEGLVMKPMKTDSFKMDVCVDSDFLGIYGKEERTDPDNVRSRTGYIITLNDCPVIWKSALQDGVCLSTMMAEYYALSTAMREVLPLRDLVRVLANGCGIQSDCLTTIRTTLWEDNMGALTLATLDPGQNTPRARFYDLKVHWF